MLGKLMTVDAARQLTWRLGRWLYMSARFDVPNVPRSNGEYELIARVVESGMAGAFVDIGANRGDWTARVVEASRSVGRPVPRCLCVEPNPELAAALRERFRGGHPVEILEIALSNHIGNAEFYLAPGTGGTSSLYHDEGAEAVGHSVTVTTFDDIMCEQEAYALVKIDAEGADARIIDGMRRAFLARRIGVCQFEYNWRWIAARSFLGDVWKFADETGYVFGKVTPRGPIAYESWNYELERFVEANYLLINPEVAGKIRPKLLRWTKYNTL